VRFPVRTTRLMFVAAMGLVAPFRGEGADRKVWRPV
jgi:hypothetical protein